VCYAFKSVYSCLAAKVQGMSDQDRAEFSAAALMAMLAASGVTADASDVGSVARSLARMERAAALLQTPSFDDTNERFYRLLAHDGAGSAA
jgi:DNA-binding GntR family transcriptional regulator